MNELRAEQVSLAYDGAPVVAEVSATLPTGGFTAIVGPNGSGKSTLLRAFARLLLPVRGRVVLDGADVHRLPTREVARRIGLLPQGPDSPDGLRVEDLVARGRYPHRTWTQRWRVEDETAVADALARTGTTALRNRLIDELSGGQRQRVWIAMVLAQETPVMLLDEPTSFLDLAHQIEVLALLRKLNRTEQRTVVVVLHEINHAARYADHLLVLHHGRIVADGPPAEVITTGLLADVFGVTATILRDPHTGGPLCVPHELVAPEGDA